MDAESEEIAEGIRKELADRKEFRRTLEDGGVYTWIMNECGMFDTDPSTIKPELIAFANRLRRKMGIIPRENLFNLGEAELEVATEIDLLNALEELAKPAEEEQ